MIGSPWRVGMVLAVVALAAGSCSTPSDDEPSLLARAPSAVDGNVVRLSLREPLAAGSHIDAFVDWKPPAPGSTAPGDRSVHADSSTLELFGLTQGHHEITLAEADASHRRVRGGRHETFTVLVRGPSVDASAPQQTRAGAQDYVELTVEGISIRSSSADSEADEDEPRGKLVFLVDPDAPPRPGTNAPPEPGRVVHTNTPTFCLCELAPGAHTIWVVIADTAGVVRDPLSADFVRVEVVA